MKKLLYKIIFFLFIIGCNSTSDNTNGTQEKKDIKEIQPTNLELNKVEEENKCTDSLIKACEEENLELLKNLVESGCDVNSKKELGNDYWICPLTYAVSSNNTLIVEFLLKNGADPNLDLGRNFTPFHYAASSSLKILSLLHKYKGNVNIINLQMSYPTPILLALEYERYDNIEYLLQNGGKIYNDSLGYYPHPLLMAVLKCDINMMDFLLKKGIDVNSRFSSITEDCWPCPFDVTALDYTIYCYKWNKKACSFEMIDFLIANGANLNSPNNKGLTPLFFAVYRNKDTELADKLIKNGAKIEFNGFSPIHAAAKFSNYKMVEYLLLKGANPNIQDNNGNTALHISFDCCGDGLGEQITLDDRMKTFELLYSHGANLYLKNIGGKASIDYLKEGDHFQIAEKLILDSVLNWEDIRIREYNQLSYKKKVVSESESYLRTHPSIHAPIIKKIKLNDTILTDMYNTFGDSIIVGKLIGNYDMVKYEGTKGFIFNGILKKLEN